MMYVYVWCMYFFRILKYFCKKLPVENPPLCTLDLTCQLNIRHTRVKKLIKKKLQKKMQKLFRKQWTDPTHLRRVMTSLIRNRLFSYVLNNNFIECDIQKRFWTGMSGKIEHTELLTHIIKNALKKQRQLVVTFFDLKNAFGEVVHHNLIRKVLQYHHVPDQVSQLILSLYTDYHVSILTKKYLTHPIKVSRESQVGSRSR